MERIIEDGVSKLKRDLLTYPNESIKKKSKRVVKNLLGHGECAPDRFFWPHAMMAQALWKYYEESGSELILNLLEEYYDKHQNDTRSIKYPDTVMNGYTLIDLYQKTGKARYEAMLESMANYLKIAPKAQDGSIIYRANQKEMIYADTIGMIVPFMCRYGAMTEDVELQKLAVEQIMNFIKDGMDVTTGLPYHAYNAESKLKYGIIGWGRAVGWILIGIADGIGFLNEEYKNQLLEAIAKLVETIVNYQREDGFFSWQLQAVDGPIDISATGMILSSLQKLLSYKIIDDKYKKVVDKVVGAIKEYDGAFNQCLAECEALSCYPQVYGEYPWGNAIVVKCLER